MSIKKIMKDIIICDICGKQYEEFDTNNKEHQGRGSEVIKFIVCDESNISPNYNHVSIKYDCCSTNCIHYCVTRGRLNNNKVVVRMPYTDENLDKEYLLIKEQDN